jgi:membrane protease YdiL (CAAX protease family)
MMDVVKRGILWAVVVYLVQIPILIACVLGLIPLHPIVIMLPLVGLLNSKVERRAREGLGLVLVRPGPSLLLALLFAVLSFAGRLIVLRMDGVALRLPPPTVDTILSLSRDFAIGVFIIALWEEIVNRGYVQTRLQEAWGFWGVIVTTLLFASLHLPSAFADYGCHLPRVLFRFVQTGLSGLVLGYVYWHTGSVLPTIALHGLSNFAGSISSHLGGVAAVHVRVSHMPFQLLWLIAQAGFMLLACRALFGESERRDRNGRRART